MPEPHTKNRPSRICEAEPIRCYDDRVTDRQGMADRTLAASVNEAPSRRDCDPEPESSRSLAVADESGEMLSPWEAESDVCTADDVACCSKSVFFIPLKDRLQVRGDYLLWWLDGFDVPSLVTTSPAGTPVPAAGVLGEPGTDTLFGNSQLNDESFSGGRVTVNYRLAPCSPFSMEASYLGIGGDGSTFALESNGSPIIARPFFNVTTGAEDASLVAYPGMLESRVDADATSRFQSAEALLRCSLRSACGPEFGYLIGYRFSRLHEQLLVQDVLLSTDPASGVALGSTLAAFDLFDTSNQFHGAELGLSTRYQGCRWSCELVAKLGLGNRRSEANVNGSTTVTTRGGATASYEGGLLALPSNIGAYTHDDFAMLEELEVTLAWALSCRLRATLGYTLVYWSRVARPGEQIDRTLNLTQLPPGAAMGEDRPEFSFHFTDFWGQGLRLGLEYQF